MADDERKRIESGNAQYFYDFQANPDEIDPVDRGGRDQRKRGRGPTNDGVQQRRPKIDPNICWFCLSNADAEKHLIVSIGTHCYATMPKGPLNERHLLVTSIGLF